MADEQWQNLDEERDWLDWLENHQSRPVRPRLLPRVFGWLAYLLGTAVLWRIVRGRK